MDKAPEDSEDFNGNFDHQDSPSRSPLKKVPFTRPSKPTVGPQLFEYQDSNDPGDKLSSPVPPLAKPRKSHLFFGRNQGLLSSSLSHCHPSSIISVLDTARRCLHQLTSVKHGLSVLIPQHGSHPSRTYEYTLTSRLAECIMTLSRQAFAPAHQMYTATLGLHWTEDLIRGPNDPKRLEFSNAHYVKLPRTTVLHSQIKLRSCVDAATEVLHRFGRRSHENLHGSDHYSELMIVLMHAFQDLYAASLGCNDLFKTFLYIEAGDFPVLQNTIHTLKSTERSELLTQFQSMRRTFDDIVIKLERLSWTAYAVKELANEKSAEAAAPCRPSSAKVKEAFKEDEESELPEELPHQFDVRRSRSRNSKRSEGDLEEEVCETEELHGKSNRGRKIRRSIFEDEEPSDDKPSRHSSRSKTNDGPQKNKIKSSSKSKEFKEHKASRGQSKSPHRSSHKQHDEDEHNASEFEEPPDRRKAKVSLISFKSLSNGGKSGGGKSKSNKNKSASESGGKRKK